MRGLLGPNDAGKSTIAAVPGHYAAPETGTVTIGIAGDPTHPRVRRTIGVAPQALAPYDVPTAEENGSARRLTRVTMR